MDTSNITWSCCAEQQPQVQEQVEPVEQAITEMEFYLDKEKNSQDRLSICSDCQHLKSLNRCELCGCFVNIKARIFFAHCPINKW